MTLLASIMAVLYIKYMQSAVCTGTRLHSRFSSVLRTSVRKHLHL